MHVSSTSQVPEGIRYSRMAGWMIALLAVVVSLPSWNNALVYDDAVLVEQDARVTEGGRLGEIFLGDYWPGNRPSYLYRPITTLSFRVGEFLGGRPAQRAIGTTLHVAVSLLVFVLLSELGLGVGAAFVGGALFAVHPAHSEVLFLVVGRGELLAAVFVLLFLVGFLRGWPPPMLAALFGLALFSKESAIMAPALAMLLAPFRSASAESYWSARRTGFLAGLCVLPVGLLFLLRHSVFGTLLSPPGFVDPLYNPLVDFPVGLRVVNGFWLLLLYLRLGFFPHPQRADYSCCQLPLFGPGSGGSAIVVLFAFAAVLAIGLLLFRRRALEGAGFLFFLAAMVPASNILFVTGTVFGERLVYLPSVGLILVLAAFSERLPGLLQSSALRLRWIGTGVLAALLVLGVLGSVGRDHAWQDEAAFSAALVEDSPRSALAHGIRFLTFRAAKDLPAAESELRTALAIYPGYYDAWVELGDLLAETDREAEAVEAYYQAAERVAERPHDRLQARSFYMKAVQIQYRMGDVEGALRTFSLAETILP